ncbi:hypothetical protein DTO195F2_2699 [Paecilomyces variotii]|nr:hypothetical protein DTO195F2_2699 [Paecilomyces variotii]KAJ9307234.1 hypothetical protein DTO217A2_3293 [Paecilomyces variotii]
MPTPKTGEIEKLRFLGRRLPTRSQGPKRTFDYGGTSCDDFGDYQPRLVHFKISKKETVAVVFQVRLRHPQVVHPNSSSDLEERQIFIVECKRPSKDTPAEWEATAGQLSHYCEQNLTGSTKIFGATAIGTKVKFWRYSIPNLTELHGGVYDLSDQSGRDNTEQSLLYIRDNGWAWTASG